MALVGNGAELEADEVLAGGEPGMGERARRGRPRSRPLGPNLGPAASRLEEGAGAAGGGV